MGEIMIGIIETTLAARPALRRCGLMLIGLMLASSAGCAKRPSAIVPVDIPMAAYTNLSCEQLAQETVKEQTALAAASKSQTEAANGDAFGVFLIGVPISSVAGGDKEGDIAVMKGKVQAIDSARKSKSCS